MPSATTPPAPTPQPTVKKKNYNPKIKAITIIVTFSIVLFLISIGLNVLQVNFSQGSVAQSVSITFSNVFSYMGASTMVALIFALFLPKSAARIVNHLRDSNEIIDDQTNS